MAVYMNGKESYKGKVLCMEEHYWLDGMLEEWAVVWNMETHSTERITVGYYGIDGSNLAGGRAEVDADAETKRDVLRTLKKSALKAFADSVTEYMTSVSKGRMCEVVKGRKVKKGTRLEVFWVGERETYRSKQYSWMHETEEVAGCYDEEGNKVWIKAEYLKPIDKLKAPNAKERKKFIKAYVKNSARAYNIKVA